MDLQRSDSIIRSSKGYREYVNSQSNLEPFDIEGVFEDDASDILSDFDMRDAFEETGNFLAGPAVLKACMESLQSSTDRSLESRLLQALFAGEEAGGDKRGRQSAALLTIREQPFPWCNLRVDDHPDPLMELTRLLKEFKEPYYQEFIREIPNK